ncbi:ATP-binding protein [Streptacidiphilus griseoplanus]|uniref:ATP-binding protein n=1 Tax=Peterkaempfera griseoplana TaxID=66896 RepID=UPI000AFE5B75|nr:ATP-binding protein [Peterkaempfera griseoplana]
MATFKARARAVDMLGRQQIAGIPTAINELFKNAHDAYAENVIGDYFREDRLLVIRDDGFGMTYGDFIDKWLVVGTESKVNAGAAPPVDSKSARPVLGEKGIGRLAVAAVGPQVLVLSRNAQDVALTFALVNWTLFTAPGIDLEDVEIPTLRIPIGELPGQEEVRHLAEGILRNLEALEGRITPQVAQTVREEISALYNLDPAHLTQRMAGPTLREVPGTQFWITPTDEMLAYDISGSPNDENEASPLFRTLIGFSDTLVPGNPAPPMAAHFYDHRSKDLVYDVIGDGEFFTPQDFQLADHQILGYFDEYGQFSGKVSVYGRDPVKHVVAWPGSRGKPTLCGPFKLNLAYVQGNRSQSRLGDEDFNRLARKLARVGGLYVYRDRVRMLPYGRSDFDWLDIERERSKSASDYFWSYRRMFGVVGIDSTANFRLQEKAGREGFRANAAYREFRDMLQNFLVQTARDFFREDSADESWRITRRELEREADARRRHDKQTRKRRADFRQELLGAEKRLSQGVPEEHVGSILRDLESDLADAVSDLDSARAAQKVIAAEARAQRAVNEVRVRFRVSRPRGVALPRGLAQDWDNYQREFEAMERSLLEHTRTEIERRSSTAAKRLGSALDRRRRFEAGIQGRISDAQTALGRRSREVVERSEELQKVIVQQANECRRKLEEQTRLVQLDMASTSTDELTDQDAADLRRALEDRIDGAMTQQVQQLDALLERMDLTFGAQPESSAGDVLDVIGSLEQEVVTLKDRADDDLELAQLGLALQVINHEFSSSIRSVRTNLRRLRSWADANRALRPVYSDLRASFEHLDAYLRLFTPLNRRLYRRDTIMKGADVERFLVDLFRERILQESISLEATPEFRNARVRAYPSTLYPVFVNLVDNAIYWLTTRSAPRVVRLHHSEREWIVEDNGPGVPTVDQPRIFELGFSRKPNGRGMGLHISRDVLRKEGWSLSLSTSPLGGARFTLQEPDEGVNVAADDQRIADMLALELDT